MAAEVLTRNYANGYSVNSEVDFARPAPRRPRGFLQSPTAVRWLADTSIKLDPTDVNSISPVTIESHSLGGMIERAAEFYDEHNKDAASDGDRFTIGQSVDRTVRGGESQVATQDSSLPMVSEYGPSTESLRDSAQRFEPQLSERNRVAAREIVLAEIAKIEKYDLQSIEPPPAIMSKQEEAELEADFAEYLRSIMVSQGMNPDGGYILDVSTDAEEGTHAKKYDLNGAHVHSTDVVLGKDKPEEKKDVDLAILKVNHSYDREEANRAFEAVFKVLRPGGAILIEVPITGIDTDRIVSSMVSAHNTNEDRDSEVRTVGKDTLGDKTTIYMRKQSSPLNNGHKASLDADV